MKIKLPSGRKAIVKKIKMVNLINSELEMNFAINESIKIDNEIMSIVDHPNDNPLIMIPEKWPKTGPINQIKQHDYIYLGDKLTDPELKGKECSAVRRKDGKCIRSNMATMLVDFGDCKCVVLARRLRKIKP